LVGESYVDNLKNLRTMAGMNQFELSRRCGVSRWKLSMVENHQLVLRPEEKIAVLEALRTVFRRNAEAFNLLSEPLVAAG
jgi:transcriptional regulator with XRE-family HTH domain